FRLLALALLRTGNSAWDPLRQYLQRKDSAAHKAEVLMEVAGVALKAGRRDEALGYYKTVAERYPEPGVLPEARFQYAELFHITQVEPAQGMTRRTLATQAVTLFSLYLDLDRPEHFPAAIKRRAALRRELGLRTEALKDYELALTKAPELAADPDLALARILISLELGRDSEVRTLLKQAEDNPSLPAENRAVLRLETASVYYQSKRCEQVEGLLSPLPAIQDGALRNRALFIRGFCRFHSGQLERASFDLETLLPDPAYQALVLDPLLTAYDRSGQHARLVHQVVELLRSGKTAPSEPLLDLLQRSYDTLGESTLFLGTLRRLQKDNPRLASDSSILFRLGVGEEAAGKPDVARALYLSILDSPSGNTEAALPPVYASALERHHSLLLAAGDLETAKARLDKAAPLFKGNPELESRLDLLRRDLIIARARLELRTKDIAPVIARLEKQLLTVPKEDSLTGAALAAVLAEGYIITVRPSKALALLEAKEYPKTHRAAFTAALASALVPFLSSLPPETLSGIGREKTLAFYQATLEVLPPERHLDRERLALQLDGYYREEGEFAKRLALLSSRAKDTPASETAAQDKRQRKLLMEWGQSLLEKGDAKGAVTQFQKARELTPKDNWRETYEITAALSSAHLSQKAYAQVIQDNEAILPTLKDERLTTQLKHFLGQVYLEWGKSEEGTKKNKSQRDHFRKALEYLPEADWQRRLAASTGLASVLRAEKKPREAAALIETLMPSLPDD
ncbi:MAG: hypothetical protein OEW39_16615, partial [Deltaproteobacteria bacterium]|nr:hypothetical protein [Deltaproteobacteria bacterium]